VKIRANPWLAVWWLWRAGDRPTLQSPRKSLSPLPHDSSATGSASGQSWRDTLPLIGYRQFGREDKNAFECGRQQTSNGRQGDILRGAPPDLKGLVVYVGHVDCKENKLSRAGTPEFGACGAARRGRNQRRGMAILAIYITGRMPQCHVAYRDLRRWSEAEPRSALRPLGLPTPKAGPGF